GEGLAATSAVRAIRADALAVPFDRAAAVSRVQTIGQLTGAFVRHALRASVGGRDALRCHGRSHGSRPGRHRRWPSPGSLVYGRAVLRNVGEPRALHPENRVARGEREPPRDAEKGSFRHQNRPSSTIVLRSGPPRTPALRERMTAPARDGELSELLFTIQS